MIARALFVIVLCLGTVIASQAQETAPAAEAAPSVVGATSEVWVTTQDFVSFRAGPGTNFERLRVLDPDLTLPAVGRSADGEWVQLEVDGQRGWVNYLLLVWSGDLVQLPIDGLDPDPFVRVFQNQVFVPAGTPLFFRQVTPQDFCCYAPTSTYAEITGHLGDGLYYWVQLNFEGQVYWTGSWALGLRGLGRNSFDTSYLYGYSRIAQQLERDTNASFNRLNDIAAIWGRLSGGQSVSCGFVPRYVEASRALDADAASYPVFEPLVRTLRSANDHINRAIALFADACSRPPDQFFIAESEVVSAFAEIELAGRDLVLVTALIDPLDQRDPINEILNGTNR
ncbi:MAG: SH3 domain-containing protein [bacterium]|nr:SH3 domain-containing protein [bacterium]